MFTELRAHVIVAKVVQWGTWVNLALLVLLETFGFFIIHVFHAANCMKTTEGSYSCSVPMFSFATDVTVWPQSLCNGV